MMKIFFLSATIFSLAMSLNTSINSGSETHGVTATENQDSSSDGMDDLDIDMIMNECNKTFRIEMAFLQSLNDSGSFTDETDRTPKCFIRCMLMNMGVVSNDGIFDPTRAAEIYAGERNGKIMEDIGEITFLCADRNERCLCDRAYQFMRCLMSMEIERYE